MGIDTFRGVMTVVLMVLFVALVFWAYSRRRKKDFDEAAQLPLDDDRRPRSRRRGDSDGDDAP